MPQKKDNKLKIIAYKKIDFSGKVGEYILRYNPSVIKHNFSVAYDSSQTLGSSGTENKYRFSEPETISFDLIFDDTVLAPEEKAGEYQVDKDIKEFKKLVFTYNGDIHRPNYLMLSWGEFIFKGQISNLSFSYTAFSSDGKALKANANVTFVQVIDTKSRLSNENKSSPDLTHFYTIKEGDSLPYICFKFYNNPAYYIDVARVNKLDNFRLLTAGDKIIIPPLGKN